MDGSNGDWLASRGCYPLLKSTASQPGCDICVVVVRTFTLFEFPPQPSPGRLQSISVLPIDAGLDDFRGDNDLKISKFSRVSKKNGTIAVTTRSHSDALAFMNISS